MAGKVVSIEIGYSITHIAEVDYEVKNPKIYRAFAIETPEGVIDDEGVHVTDEFTKLMRQGILDNGIQTMRAVFVMSSSRIANREVTIPYVPDKKIHQILVANAKDYFPVDLSKYQLVHRVIEKLKQEKQMKLSVYAVPNSLILSYQHLARSLDLQLVALDYYGNGIYQSMTHNMKQQTMATLCIADNNSMVTVIKDGKVLLQRSIGYGLDDAVYAMQQTPLVQKGSSYLEVLSAMQMNACFNDALSLDNPERRDRDANKNARVTITRSLTMLIGNISRVLDYFASRNSDIDIDQIKLIGLGTDCKGLDQLLTNELGVKVVPIKSFGNADTTSALSSSRFSVGEYFINLGSAIDPLRFMLEEDQKQHAREEMRLPVIVFGGCVAISVVLVLVGLIANLFISAKNRGLQKDIDSKMVAVEIYNNYVEKKVIKDNVVQMDGMTKSTNSQFLEFMAQMKERMPSDLMISSMTASSEGIVLLVTTDSKESASEAIMQIRQFTCAATVSCGEVKEETNEQGVTSESFEIDVTYSPLPQENTEDQDTLDQTDTQAADEQTTQAQ